MLRTFSHFFRAGGLGGSAPHRLLKPRFLASSQSSTALRSSTPNVDVKAETGVLRLVLEGQKSVKMHSFWLRENCRCPECYHPFSNQRMVDTLLLPRNVSAASARIETPQGRDPVLHVEWANDGHQSQYPLRWLIDNCCPSAPRKHPLDIRNEVKLWSVKDLPQMPTASYDKVLSSNEELGTMLEKVAAYGFCMVDGCPATVADTEKLCVKIGPVRNTLYGMMWNFQADMSMQDTAWTNMFLGAHTDGTYFTDPPGLQLLHIIEYKATGGDNLLVDAFHCAELLRREDPAAFKLLATTPIPHEYVGDNNHLLWRGPILNVDENGRLVQVRFNNYDRCPLDLSVDVMDGWYQAYLKLVAHIRDAQNELWFPLRPGRVMVMDNWRVLHGRDSYIGPRRVTGAYITMEDYVSRVRYLRSVSPA